MTTEVLKTLYLLAAMRNESTFISKSMTAVAAAYSTVHHSQSETLYIRDSGSKTISFRYTIIYVVT
jgi:hypothetical protein